MKKYLTILFLTLFATILCAQTPGTKRRAYVDSLYLKYNGAYEIFHKDSIRAIIGDSSHFNSIKDSATFQSFIDGSGFHTLVVEDSFSFQRNDTIPDNLSIIMGRNGMIRNRDGLLTINAQFSAGRWKCFESDSGSLIIQNPIPNYVFLEWWGAGNNLSDSLVNDSSFIKALSVCNKSKVDFVKLSGSYYVTHPIVIWSQTGLEGGAHPFSASIQVSPGFDFSSPYQGSDSVAILMGRGLAGGINTFMRPTLENILVDGNNVSGANGIYMKIQQPSKFNYIRIQECPGYAIELFSTQQTDIENIMIVQCGTGIIFNTARFIHFYGGLNIEQTTTPFKFKDDYLSGNAVIQMDGLHIESMGNEAGVTGLQINASQLSVSGGDTVMYGHGAYTIINMRFSKSGLPIAIYDTLRSGEPRIIGVQEFNDYIPFYSNGRQTGAGVSENTFDMFLWNQSTNGTQGRYIGLSSVNNMIKVRSESATKNILTAGVSDDSLSRFVIDANGKMSWGSGSAAIDANFYRSQANTIASDDTLWIKALGVGNSVTNTNTPSGATANAIPIYNSLGVLIGYIPVYGSQW